MKIGQIDTREKVFVIAEIGNNHEGDFELAGRLITEAAACGADAVKFQTIVPERLVDRSDPARIEQLRKFQFSREQFENLKERADAEGVLFLSTPFDLDSAEWLNDLVPAFKVASGDNTFWPLLDFLTSTGKPLLLSTGLILHDDLLRLKDFLDKGWKKHGVAFPGLALLHCVVNYPTSDADANLRRMTALTDWDLVTPGYSDHTLGIEAAILSVALGARVVEKHFTLDKTRASFRDHQLSADPADLRDLVSGIRKAELLLGSANWDDRSCELEIGPRVRRSIAAKRDLSAGQEVGPADLIWVRPGSGWAPGLESEVVGRSLSRPILAGEIFLPHHFETSCVE
jgi:N,N'-diacetyllegionaminate synthase